MKQQLANNNSLSFLWSFNVTVSNDTFEFLPSFIVKSHLGNANAWTNGTWTTDKVGDVP